MNNEETHPSPEELERLADDLPSAVAREMPIGESQQDDSFDAPLVEPAIEPSRIDLHHGVRLRLV